MGLLLGEAEGESVSPSFVGAAVLVGAKEGVALGAPEGLFEGDAEGAAEGLDDGLAEGDAEGSSVGLLLGDAVSGSRGGRLPISSVDGG